MNNDFNSELCDKGFRTLSLEIVRVAVEDYKRAIRGKQSVPGRSPGQVKRECEKFFKSDYFHMLCNLDGQRVIDRCNAEYEKELEKERLDE